MSDSIGEPKGKEIFECLERALNQQWIYHDPAIHRVEEVTLTIHAPDDRGVTLTASVTLREVPS